MIMKNILPAAVLIMLLWLPLYSVEYEIPAEIESIRQPDNVTIFFDEKPETSEYYITDRKLAVGTVTIISFSEIKKGKYRAVASYKINTKNYTLRAGASVALVKKREMFDLDLKNTYYKEQLVYRKSLVSEKDGRQMVLVPAGKFILGSSDFLPDEAPEQEIYLDDFYIDRFEVSNEDYRKFSETENGLVPVSWKDGKMPEGQENLPVLVTYYEASAYAAWAGKRLPTEEEWEKAAKGNGRGKKGSVPVNYSWAGGFSAGRANCLPFWKDEKLRKDIKSKIAGKGPALLPVDVFAAEGASPYGAVNMCGNAQEWTSSWFKAYPGNTDEDGRFGTQYRVVRGGAWFSSADGIRVTRRETGGIPSLEKDCLSGFRCVKDPSAFDRVD